MYITWQSQEMGYVTVMHVFAVVESLSQGLPSPGVGQTII